MMDRFQERRAAAALRVAQTRIPITDPRFNLREMVKQMILLEDHLFHKDKHCADCINKHLLTIEAFAEEGVTLTMDDAPLKDLLAAMSETAKVWLESFHDGVSPLELGRLVRQERKKLAPHFSDPREVVARIALCYLSHPNRHHH